jgi:hypothetical protein
MLNLTRISAATAIVCSLFAASISNAATVTFEIEIDGVIGMFDAPDSGGLIESFSITLDGVTFDLLGTGTAAPTYDAVANDIRGNPGTEGFIQNTVAGGVCAAMECVLGLEDSVDPGVIPGLYAIFPLDNGIPGGVTNSGEYSITPPDPVPAVPLPASLPLLLAGLGGLAISHKRKRH